MSTCATLLSRLERVRQTAPDRWIARCPAHEDRSPSLSIRLSETGNLLVRCRAGCDTGDALAAVGLTLANLFPNGPGDHRSKPSRATIPAADLVLMIDEETTVVSLAAASFLESRELTEADWERLATAARRIGYAAAELRRGRPWRPPNGR